MHSIRPVARQDHAGRGAGSEPLVGTYRVSDAAGALGISAATLRLWEREGVVKPERTPDGSRPVVFNNADPKQGLDQAAEEFDRASKS